MTYTMARIKEFKDYYKILNISDSANQEEIKKSIRNMVEFLKTEEGVTREGVNPYYEKIIKDMEEVSK